LFQMMRFVLAAAAAAFISTPALAALPVGAKAPDFKATAFQAGKQFDFNLAQALKKGPVVLYFFPAAHTTGCNIEAHLFADAIDKFKAEGATVIGVTAGNVDQLAAFSTETEHCSGKFPVAADPNAAIAKQCDAGATPRLVGPHLVRDLPERRDPAGLLRPEARRARQPDPRRRHQVAVRPQALSPWVRPAGDPSNAEAQRGRKRRRGQAAPRLCASSASLY